jgi:hypothetical protein
MMKTINLKSPFMISNSFLNDQRILINLPMTLIEIKLVIVLFQIIFSLKRSLLFPPPGFLFHPRVSLNAPNKKGRTTRAVFLHEFSTPYVEKWYGKRDTYSFKSTDYKSRCGKSTGREIRTFP